MIRPRPSTAAQAESGGRNSLQRIPMATTTDTPDEQMTAQRWFEEGGQQAELQRIGKIKNSEQQLQALAQFNERNTAFMAERTSPTQPPPLPQQREKAQTHPAIEEAINEAMRTETGWMRDLNSMSDEQLRERRLNRLMDQDRNRGRLESVRVQGIAPQSG